MDNYHRDQAFDGDQSNSGDSLKRTRMAFGHCRRSSLSRRCSATPGALALSESVISSRRRVRLARDAALTGLPGPLAGSSTLDAKPGANRRVHGDRSTYGTQRRTLTRWRPCDSWPGIASVNDSMPSNNPIARPSVTLSTLTWRGAGSAARAGLRRPKGEFERQVPEAPRVLEPGALHYDAEEGS